MDPEGQASLCCTSAGDIETAGSLRVSIQGLQVRHLKTGSVPYQVLKAFVLKLLKGGTVFKVLPSPAPRGTPFVVESPARAHSRVEDQRGSELPQTLPREHVKHWLKQ